MNPVPEIGPVMSDVYLGLGGNVGDVQKNMATALRQLDGNPAINIKTVSPVYRTPPWGFEDQDWFLNCCVLLETAFEPETLLDFALSIEVKLKRTRQLRWGPRTLDIDILLFGDQQVKSENLTIPHPRIAEREFVVRPLFDINPDLTIGGLSCRELLENIPPTDMKSLALKDNWWF